MEVSRFKNFPNKMQATRDSSFYCERDNFIQRKVVGIYYQKSDLVGHSRQIISIKNNWINQHTKKASKRCHLLLPPSLSRMDSKRSWRISLWVVPLVPLPRLCALLSKESSSSCKVNTPSPNLRNAHSRVSAIAYDDASLKTVLSLCGKETWLMSSDTFLPPPLTSRARTISSKSSLQASTLKLKREDSSLVTCSLVVSLVPLRSFSCTLSTTAEPDSETISRSNTRVWWTVSPRPSLLMVLQVYTEVSRSPWSESLCTAHFTSEPTTPERSGCSVTIQATPASFKDSSSLRSQSLSLRLSLTLLTLSEEDLWCNPEEALKNTQVLWTAFKRSTHKKASRDSSKEMSPTSIVRSVPRWCSSFTMSSRTGSPRDLQHEHEQMFIKRCAHKFSFETKRASFNISFIYVCLHFLSTSLTQSCNYQYKYLHSSQNWLTFFLLIK